MDKQEEQRVYRFQKLTPCESVDMEGYKQSLDFVFQEENEDLRNIALTGNYGSGKSSVIRSYAENRKDLSFIYISLAHFDGVSGETDKENYDVIVEEKIINHLVQQIPLDNVPESGFRIKRSFSIRGGIYLSIRIAVLFCIITYLKLWTTMYGVQDCLVWNLITKPVVTSIILCVGFLDVVSLVYSVVKGLNTRKKIKSLKLQNGSVEFSDQSEKSYFDQHLDEILYLISESKVDAIVYEDIDRFGEIDLKVLEHLRELCTLANDRIRNIDKEGKPIRFFYLIGDHVFNKHTDRTKFFDYMIPVIPVVDTSNSYAKMRELFELSGDYVKFNDRFLRGLCLFLDDLRTIKNVVNEFQVYSTKLVRTAKDANRLLALIVYKNLYPDDFTRLQQERGYLYAVLNSKARVTRAETERIESEIDGLKKKLDSVDREMLISTEELEVIRNERQSNSARFNDYKFNEWDSKIYPVRKELIKTRSSNESQKIRARIAEKQMYLAHIRNLHLSKLINDDNEAIIFGYDQDGNKSDEVTLLRNKENNQLVEFLVKNGFIDETTYRDYIAIFYEKGMSYIDKEFLIAVNSHNGKSFDYEIQDIDLLLENLAPDDFVQTETRNFRITDYLVEHNMDEYIQKFVFQLQENTDYEFIAQYIRVSKCKTEFVKALNKYWTTSIVALVSDENRDMSLEEIQNYVICSLAHICKGDLIGQNQDNIVSQYIMDKFENATCESEDCNSIAESLLQLEIKFPDINRQIESDDFRKAIYDRNLYALNRKNVESILEMEYGLEPECVQCRELTAVYSDPHQPLFEYVDNNINVFVKEIMLEDEQILDDSDIATDVLNNDSVSAEIKEHYIELLANPFESLEGIEDGQWKTILMYGMVVCNVGEILRFYNCYGFTDELTEYINSVDDALDYASYEDVEGFDEFYDASLKNKDLDDSRYAEIVRQIGKPLPSFSITDIGDEKVRILVDEGLITMNSFNLQFMRQYYPGIIPSFVEKDVNGYLGLVQGSNFVSNEAVMLLEDQNIDLGSRQKLVDRIPTVITLKGHEYDDDIIKYIISQKYDTNDITYLLERYNSFPEDIQETTYNILKGQMGQIKNNISLIAPVNQLLWRIFEDSDISVVEKSNLIDLIMVKEIDVDLEIILQKMGFSNMTKLVSGDTTRLPQIKNGPEEKAVLNVLKKHDYVVDFSVDEETDTIKVDRKKSI